MKQGQAGKSRAEKSSYEARTRKAKACEGVLMKEANSTKSRKNESKAQDTRETHTRRRSTIMRNAAERKKPKEKHNAMLCVGSRPNKTHREQNKVEGTIDGEQM